MTDLCTTLPGGVLDELGTRHRVAVIRPLTGHDEELLASAAAPAAVLVTRLLARCTERVGAVAMTEQVARDLSVGDRQALLLALRQATFGPRVAAVVVCPWRDCGRRMDIDFAIPDIPVTQAADLLPEYQVTLSSGGDDAAERAERVVRFRLPTGADQAAIGELALSSPLAALDTLLERCVAGGKTGLSPRDKAEIEQAMRAEAYGPQLTFDATCPECRRTFTLPFDIQDFFFGEVTGSLELLLRDVHHLALHYHWTEGEVLGLPRERRQRYLQILADELGRQTDALV